MAKKSKTTRKSAKRGGRKKASARVGASAKKASSRTKPAKKKVKAKTKAKAKSVKKRAKLKANVKVKSAAKKSKTLASAKSAKKKASRGSSKKKVAKRVAAKKASTVRRKKVKRGAAKSASRRGVKKVAKRSVVKRSGAKKVSAARRKTVKRVVASRAKNERPTSTKAAGKVVAKRTVRSSRNSAPSPTSQDPIQFPEEARVTPKTYLNAAQLAEFKDRLLEKRRELSGDVKDLARDAFQKDSGGGERTTMPIHMAELGSDNWEHEFTLGLIENEQARMRQIDEALVRIEKKTYGVCVASHRRINIARLRAKPWAKYCIEHARAREEGRAR